jgi:hypothetical protein
MNLTVKNKKRVTRHYVNNADFYSALVDYKNKCATEKSPKIPNYIGECILEICKRLSTKPNFVSYTFREEMIGDAMENCIMYIGGFDPERGENPFAYFTQIAWNAMIRRIDKEKKQTYLKYKNMQNLHFLQDDNNELKHIYDEVSTEIINSFENKLTKTKKKNTITGLDQFIENKE